jgi:hypothetical protein
MTATQKLVRQVETAREVAQTSRLALNAAEARLATLTAAAKQAKAAVKAARKQAKAAKHAAKAARAAVAAAAKISKKAAKKALKLEQVLGALKKKRSARPGSAPRGSVTRARSPKPGLSAGTESSPATPAA